MKDRKTPVVGNISEKTAKKWAEDRGDEHDASGKKRHYEVEPDEDNPGKFKLSFVEDE